MSTDATLTRWRLLLGSAAESACGGLSGDAMAAEGALDWLYGREQGEAAREQMAREGGSGPSSLSVPEWINEVHRLFPKETIERLEREVADLREKLGDDWDTRALWAWQDKLYLLENNGTLYAVDANTGEYEQFGDKGAYADTVAATIHEGVFYAVEDDGGHKAWVTRAHSDPSLRRDLLGSAVILNGSPYGFFANHSLVMANYIARANASIIELRKLLERG